MMKQLNRIAELIIVINAADLKLTILKKLKYQNVRRSVMKSKFLVKIWGYLKLLP